MAVMLDVKNINVYYGAIHAVKDISFQVNEGEIVTLIGANGAGKTTTLQTVSGLLHTRTGSIEFLGQPIQNVPASKLVGRGLAQVPEGRRVFQQMTVEENLEMGGFTQPASTIAPGLERVYEQFPRLKERRRQGAGTLSGGEQQRIAIARAILKNAPILILDEATAFADPDNEVRVQQALSALSKGKTVIMIAHRLSSITDADCIYVLQDGEIVESGTHSGLIEKNGIFTKMWKNYSEAAEWKIAKEVNA